MNNHGQRTGEKRKKERDTGRQTDRQTERKKERKKKRRKRIYSTREQPWTKNRGKGEERKTHR